VTDEEAEAGRKGDLLRASNRQRASLAGVAAIAAGFAAPTQEEGGGEASDQGQGARSRRGSLTEQPVCNPRNAIGEWRWEAQGPGGKEVRTRRHQETRRLATARRQGRQWARRQARCRSGHPSRSEWVREQETRVTHSQLRPRSGSSATGAVPPRREGEGGRQAGQGVAMAETERR